MSVQHRHIPRSHPLAQAVDTHGAATEGQVVKEIVAALEALGYGKPPTGGARGFYLLAGQRNTTHSGSDSGVPDILVIEPRRCWLFEAKARDKDIRIKPAQDAMWARGCIEVVNTAEQVMALLEV